MPSNALSLLPFDPVLQYPDLLNFELDGVAFGLSNTLDRLMEVTVEAIRPIPSIALLPIALIVAVTVEIVINPIGLGAGIMLGLTGYVTSVAMSLAEHRLLVWQPSQR